MTENNEKEINNIERMTWLLYSDANNRFNIMIEECAHLQNTLFSYLDAPYNHEFVFGMKEQNGECHRNWWAGESVDERECKKDSKHDQKDRIPPQQRSIINLIDFLGSLIDGMTKNQDNLQTHFLNALQAGDNPEKDRNFFWLMALRGEYINHDIEGYTYQIEHAHEKVVQLLENSPGFLPQPILLRRWNSAIQEEFLSRYASQTNFEIAELLCGMRQEEKFDINIKENKEKTREFWHGISVSHSWTHAGTSRFMEHQVQRPSKDATQRFVALRSTYFYLEQPVIFPLLYHECAHTWLSKSIARLPDYPEIDQFRFVKDLGEAVDDLRIIGDNCWEGDINFPKILCEEAWADAISIVLGGSAYLAALAFQLFGQDGTCYFNSDWAQVPIEQCGASKHRVKPLFLRRNKMPRYWWARLRLAYWLLTKMDERRQTDDENASKDDSWLKALDTCLKKWFESGKEVFSSELLGNIAFQEEWACHQKLNEWIFAIWQRRIEPHIGKLYDIKKQQGDVYALPPQIQECIFGTFLNYSKNYFPDQKNTPGSVKTGTLLECATNIRWEVSKLIVKKLKDEQGKGTNADSLAIFSNYIRNDGSVAFRIGLEWWLMIISVWDEIYDACKVDDKENADLKKNIDSIKELCENGSGKSLESEIENLLENKENLRMWIREKSYFLPEKSSGFSKAVSEILLKCFLRFVKPEEGKVPVHTLTIGAMRFSKQNNKITTYHQKLKSIEETFSNQNNMFQEKVNKFSGKEGPQAEKLRFYPLIGDYHFALFTPQTTPSERDFHCHAPKMLLKPRVLWTVATNSKEQTNDEDGSMLLLVHYQHRWRWLKTADELDKLERKEGLGAKLYLSSGWEDVVLHLPAYNKDGKCLLLNKEAWTKLGVYGGVNGVDCHTLVVCPGSINGENPDGKKDGISSGQILAAVEGEGVPLPLSESNYKDGISSGQIFAAVRDKGVLYCCAGRYDYKITWHKPKVAQGNKEIKLLDYCNTWLDNMDGLSDLFTGIWSINTAMFMQISDCTKDETVSCKEWVVESTVMLNQKS